MKWKYFGFFAFTFVLLFTNYIPVHAAQYNQQSTTAYTAYPDARTYHGTIPRKYITAAVHPKTCGSPTSGTIFPYGTYIRPVSPISVPGGSISRLTVEDMGDVYCNRGFTTYWFDIYFGVKPTYDQDARNYGTRVVSYDISYPALVTE